MPDASTEIRTGQRFAFGRNWSSFLNTLNDDRIHAAEDSLRRLLEITDLQGKSFLDVGCGSGLFSLAARRLGARVHSFDFDPQSVACAEELKRRYFPDDSNWTIEQGSALDRDYLQSVGRFDVVYSWGVLHHTGEMWQAVDNVSTRVEDRGMLVIALYNDQGWRSQVWRGVKRIYCSSSAGKLAICALFFPWFLLRTILVSLLRRRNEFRAYREDRGMSIVHDWHDWLGGLPYEVARPESVVEFLEARGFQLKRMTRTFRLGCNEFVFVRSA